METTERIVEAYVRYIKGWATIPNIRCEGQLEIDLLAINLLTLERYHIEIGVSISGTHSKLTDKPFSQENLKKRVEAASQRRTIGYFIERKFGAKSVQETLEGYGFQQGKYGKVIVTWGWTKEAKDRAKAENIELWNFPHLLREIVEKFKDKRIYFTDDTLRTLHLYSHTMKFDKP
jgi:hypothetical protein